MYTCSRPKSPSSNLVFGMQVSEVAMLNTAFPAFCVFDTLGANVFDKRATDVCKWLTAILPQNHQNKPPPYINDKNTYYFT